jgi:hypothetical protein
MSMVYIHLLFQIILNVGQHLCLSCVTQVPPEEQNIFVVNLFQLEHVVGVTELSSFCSDF